MTASQLAANQANALLSTGPVTPEGKAASSRNAIRHGLTAKSGMLASDDPEEYRKHCQVFFDRLAHRDEIERAVIQDIADIEWKLKRIPAIESAILDSGDVRGLRGSWLQPDPVHVRPARASFDGIRLKPDPTRYTSTVSPSSAARRCTNSTSSASTASSSGGCS